MGSIVQRCICGGLETGYRVITDTKNKEMVMGICIAFIAVALIAGVAGANYGYTRGEHETNARWTAHLSDKEEEIVLLQKELKEIATDFESAKQIVGSTLFIFAEELVNLQIAEINLNHVEALNALNQLFTIAEAWNKEDGFVPDFSDWNQGKWFPWFKYDEDAAGFVYAYTCRTPTAAGANFGSRLCFKSSARAAQFGNQFADPYNKVFL